MQKIEGENQEPKIIRQWGTEEINPQEIADVLGGVLEESADINPKLNIHLYYGEPRPVLTLKCDPDNRSIFLVVNEASDATNKRCRSVIALADIEKISFIEYAAAVPGGVTTDMIVKVKGNTASSMVVSKNTNQPVF